MSITDRTSSIRPVGGVLPTTYGPVGVGYTPLYSQP